MSRVHHSTLLYSFPTLLPATTFSYFYFPSKNEFVSDWLELMQHQTSGLKQMFLSRHPPKIER